MRNRKSTLFKLGCSVVGISYVVISAGILLQGVIPFMARCGLPEPTLESPHYADAIFFHFFDMLVIGLLITIAGLVESLTFQRVFSSAMLVIQSVYLYLDVRTSDTPWAMDSIKVRIPLRQQLLGSYSHLFSFCSRFLHCDTAPHRRRRRLATELEWLRRHQL